MNMTTFPTILNFCKGHGGSITTNERLAFYLTQSKPFYKYLSDHFWKVL